jgi:hypothetical protein
VCCCNGEYHQQVKGIDMALGIIRTRITAIETRRVKAPEKTADSIYHTLNTAAGVLG